MSKKMRPEWAPSDYRTNRSALLRAEESRKKNSMIAAENWRQSRLDRQASGRSTIYRSSMHRRPSKPSLRKREPWVDRDQLVREQLLRDQATRERKIRDELREKLDQLHTAQGQNTVLAMVSGPAPPKSVVWRKLPATDSIENDLGHLKSDEGRPDSDTPIEDFNRLRVSRISIESIGNSDGNPLLATEFFEENKIEGGRVTSGQEPRLGVIGYLKSLKNSLFQSSMEPRGTMPPFNNLIEESENISSQKNRTNASLKARNKALDAPGKISVYRELPNTSELVSLTLAQRGVSSGKDLSGAAALENDLPSAIDLSGVTRPSVTKDYPSSVQPQGHLPLSSAQTQKNVSTASAQAHNTVTSTQKSISTPLQQTQASVSNELNKKKDNASPIRFQKNPTQIISAKSSTSTRALRSTSRELPTATTRSSAPTEKNSARTPSGSKIVPSRQSRRSTSVTAPQLKKETSELRSNRRPVSREQSIRSTYTEDRDSEPYNRQRTRQGNGRRPRTPRRSKGPPKSDLDSLEALKEQISILHQEKKHAVIRRLEEKARLKREELAATRFKIRVSLEEEIENNKKLEKILAKIKALKEAGEKGAFCSEDSQVDTEVCELKDSCSESEEVV